MNRGCSLLLVVGVYLFAAFGTDTTEANLGAAGGTNISTFNISNKQQAEIDAKYDTDWHRLSNGSIDMKLHKEYVLKKFKRILNTTEQMCTAIDVGNQCQPYYLAIERDLNAFLGELGRFIKFYDQALVKIRGVRQRNERRNIELAKNVINSLPEGNPTSVAPDNNASNAPENLSLAPENYSEAPENYSEAPENYSAPPEDATVDANQQ